MSHSVQICFVVYLLHLSIYDVANVVVSFSIYGFSIDLDWSLYAPSAFGFLNFLRLTVSPMENKRDATVAGLGWPSTSNRGTLSTHPDASTIEAPAHTTSTPSASLEAMTTPNDPGTTMPMDTYSAPPQPAVPFPTQDSSPFNALRHTRFSSRVVHQIHFKIFTHSNNTRELFIEEISTSGISKCRDPEHYFYALSSNWEWSLRTADYWRHHFEIPLLHGHNPFHNVPIETTSSPDETGLATRIQDLAKQLSDTLTAATASGEFNETWRMVEHMSFHDAIQILQQASNFPSE